MHDLPVFFYINGPIVVIFGRCVVVRLFTSCIEAGLLHVCVLASCALSLPGNFSILAVVLGRVLGWRARRLGGCVLWFGLGRRCGFRWGLL